MLGAVTVAREGISETLANPILNSPFDPPESHLEIGLHGPTGKVLTGRRPSESYIPVPASRKKGRGLQEEIDFDVTGERREVNSLINDVRREVERWRANNWNGVTPYTRKLLLHWSAAEAVRDEPVFFCQREAAETAIFLAEVAGRHGTADYRSRLDAANALHNNGLPRIALKMATGAGKTVVMAMLVAWQTVNKVMTPRDARFTRRFLVVTPGITIRDRLGVLHPERHDSYYRQDQRDLVPPELWDAVLRAHVQVMNYHAFLPKDDRVIHGVAANTRKLLRGNQPQTADPFRETPDAVAARMLRELGGSEGGIVVMNDEAHHCYQDRLLEHPDDAADREDEERNREARRWFEGIELLRRRTDIKAVYDLSATPYYLKGSGYNEGFIFPWTVSDFSLMDAIESGIVKVPRIPVDDDAAGMEPVYLNLWDHIAPPLPKRRQTRTEVDAQSAGWAMPATLQGALESLYRSYAKNHERYEAELAVFGEPPPVMIVVCPNTVVSKLVYDWVAGLDVQLADGALQARAGNLELLSNVIDGRWLGRQRTILVDSAQLESGEPLGADFRRDAAREIEEFKRLWRERNPGADAEQLTDADFLREAMNTVGKRGRLGEHIRCVVSVGMLTEGWDANTVTHILGIRPFRSQLLCEQVVGRGLRRRDYTVNSERHMEPEYAEIYGVPFAFIPSDQPTPRPKQARPPVEVRALPERWRLAIGFPKVDGYRVELADAPLSAKFSNASGMELLVLDPALWVLTQGVAGTPEQIELEEIRRARPQEVAFRIARTLLEDERFFGTHPEDRRPWLFPQLVAIARSWMAGCLTLGGSVPVGQLLFAQHTTRAAEKIYSAIVQARGDRRALLLPLLRRFDRSGSTDDVRFITRKAVMEPQPEKSHLNHVVLDGARGNSWEEALASYLEKDARVRSYVKNERLGFTIPYIHEGRTHEYIPDFLVALQRDDDVERTIIVEVSGSRKSPGPTEAKADTARHLWCRAVNNVSEFGLWGYVEVHNPRDEQDVLSDAIDALLRMQLPTPVGEAA